MSDMSLRLRQKAQWLETRSFAELHGTVEREAAKHIDALEDEVERLRQIADDKEEAAERYTDVMRYIRHEYANYDDAIKKGKGEWPNPTYVRDETWAEWHAARRVLAHAIYTATGDYPKGWPS